MRGEDVPFYTTARSAVTFKTNVGIGSPPTYYTLIVDTGSANTWVSARGKLHPFRPTKTSRETNRDLSIRYGSGGFRGKLWFDRVTLGNLVIENQGIGVAMNAFGFDDDVDGILGLGPTELTIDSLVKDDGNGFNGENSEMKLRAIPTILDNLFAQGKIRRKVLAISFDRMSNTIKSKDYAGRFQGVLTFGGVDPSRYVGEITYVPIPDDKPSSKHWSLEQRISYCSATGEVEILKNGIGVIDTGTSVVHLTLSSFDAYKNATKADFGYYTGLLSLSQEQRGELKSLFFEIGGRRFEITPEEQIWPQELNDIAGGPPDDSYLVYVELLNNNGVDIQLINGFTWLQQFYIVLDAENRQIGVAKSVSSLHQSEAGTALDVKEKELESDLVVLEKPASAERPCWRTLTRYIWSHLSSLTFFTGFFRFTHASELRLRLSNLCTSFRRRTDP